MLIWPNWHSLLFKTTSSARLRFTVGVSGSGSALTFAAPVRLFGGVRRAHGAVQQSTGLAISNDGSRLFLVEGLEQPESNVIHVMIPAAKAR